MKQNQFYISYFGNKRNEVKDIVQCIPKLETYKKIIEPFCGSCAISYYIWTLYPDKEFILNDNNIYLKEMYDIIKDDDKIKEFEDYINGFCMDNVLDSKDHYVSFLKNNKNLKGWFIMSKYYCIRPGLYAQKTNSFRKFYIKDYPIYKFFKEGNITFICGDSIECYKLYKDEPLNCIIMDPPYLMTCNDFYHEKDVNIYQYLLNNDINNEKAFICLILEDMWIMKLLFPEVKYNIVRYNKLYQTTKKKTIHMVITNDF